MTDDRSCEKCKHWEDQYDENGGESGPCYKLGFRTRYDFWCAGFVSKWSPKEENDE